MPEKKKLVPREGLLVPDPVTGKSLPPEGAERELTTYWHRRIKDGDVTVAGDRPARKAREE